MSRCRSSSVRRWGQPGEPVDVEHQRWGSGHDHPTGAHLAPRGVHHGVPVVLGDPPHRRGQRHDVAEPAGEPQRDLLGAADEPPLLRAVDGVGVAGEGADVAFVARAGDVPEDVEEGELVRVGAEAWLGPALDQVLHPLGVDRVAADPLAERHPVPLDGVRVCPRGVDRDLGCVLVDAGEQLRGVGEDRRVRRHGALVLHAPGRRGHVDAVAVDVLLEGGHPQLLGQAQDVALGRTDEGAAGLDHPTGAEVVVEHPAADAVPGLDEEHRAPPAGHLAGRDQAGDAAPDHDHVDLAGQRSLQAPGRCRRGEGSGAEAGQ